MQAAPDENQILPFPPGTSPFHIKGLVYRQHVEYAEANIPGGNAAVNAMFRDPAMRAFFEQPFLAATWYDALPIVSVWYACARVLGQPAIEFLRARTKHQANHDIHTVYRMWLKLASAESVALRMPRVMQAYFDFGSTDARIVRPGVVRIDHAGTPAILAPWLAVVGDTYVRVALELAGSREIHVRRTPPTPGGTAHGIPIVDLSAEVQFARQ